MTIGRVEEPPGSALPRPAPIEIGGRRFAWGERTYVMGIVNVTPDSFSGDGLLGTDDGWVDAAVAQAERMVAEGADLIDIGGESSRPGHVPVAEDVELGRVVAVIAAVADRLPSTPISIDTTKPSVAAAAIEAGASLVNDIWGVDPDRQLARVAAEREIPIVLMHNRAEPRYRGGVIAEVARDLRVAIDHAVGIGVPIERIIVDPGFGFGKTAEQNLEVLHDLGDLRMLGRPILLGTSRKSTLGRVTGLPVDDRLEATLATTALGIVFGADIIRAHDVTANVRVARMTDAIVRGWAEPGAGE